MIPNLRSLCCFWQMIKLGVIPPLGTRETAAWIIQQQTEWLLKCEKETLLTGITRKGGRCYKKESSIIYIIIVIISWCISPFFWCTKLVHMHEKKWGKVGWFQYLFSFNLLPLRQRDHFKQRMLPALRALKPNSKKVLRNVSPESRVDSTFI